MAELTDFAALKRGGFIKQRQQDFFSVRLRAPAGFVTTEQLARVQDAADRYGRGYVHLTARQGIEIPWVRLEAFEALKSALGEAGVIPAGCGPRVRNVMACPGSATCSRGVVDCQALATELDAGFFGRELPIKKFKIAISGCANSCTTPQVNDVGLVGVSEPELDASLCSGCELCVDACREGALTMVDGLPERDVAKCLDCGDCISVCPLDAWQAARTGYDLFVGGKVGRHPQLGARIGQFLTPEASLLAVQGIVTFIEERCNAKERFGALLNRIGVTVLSEYLNVGETACAVSRS